MFLNGQKVVCVDDTFPQDVVKFYSALPEKDKTYVVRGMSPGIAFDNKTEELAVYLEGLVNPNSSQPPCRERGFKAERFVPLQELTEEEINKVSEMKPEVVAA